MSAPRRNAIAEEIADEDRSHEIRLRPKTNEAHRGFKVDDARRWLLHGNKVRVTIKFRGREMDYPEIALEDLKEIAAALADVSVGGVASDGRANDAVVLAPSKGGAKRKRRRNKPPLRKKRQRNADLSRRYG
ncbi:MAG: translation initiation factor IF-3 C-terminal domain-containing protein [Anaerolineales bacterium]